ncbi:MAG TPA: acyl-CoA dehydrogenase family protein [Nannocystis sp.]
MPLAAQRVKRSAVRAHDLPIPAKISAMLALRGAERDALYSFACAQIRPTTLARDEAAAFDRALWRRLADTGVFASALAGDHHAAARAFAGLAHGGLDLPLGLSAVAQWIGIHLLARFGSPAQRAQHLDPLVSGAGIVAVCNAETGAGTDLRRMRSRVEPDGAGGHRAIIHKSSASNLSDADLALVSAWHHRDDGPPVLAVFVLPARAPFVQTSHVEQLAGFRTGLTGALDAPDPLPIRLPDALLGDDGPRVLRSCFDLERLLIGALIHGSIDGLFDLADEHLHARARDDPAFCSHQYVQDKLATIYTLARRTEAMVALALATPELDGALLSAVKLGAVDDALLAVTTAQELFGYTGYLRATFVQKLLRDLLAFKMLGGTRELMKIALFRELKQRWTRDSG